jgi:hypothetical protein
VGGWVSKYHVADLSRGAGEDEDGSGAGCVRARLEFVRGAAELAGVEGVGRGRADGDGGRGGQGREEGDEDESHGEEDEEAEGVAKEYGGLSG